MLKAFQQAAANSGFFSQSPGPVSGKSSFVEKPLAEETLQTSAGRRLPGSHADFGLDCGGFDFSLLHPVQQRLGVSAISQAAPGSEGEAAAAQTLYRRSSGSAHPAVWTLH